MDKSVKKKIKITSRGIVTTSRGRARTPLGPYMERLGNISAMIIREKATVVELLPDGTEVPLSIQNFDKDTTKPVDVPAPKEEKVTSPKTDVAPEVKYEPTNRQLSRKERKRQEYEKKAAEANKPVETKPEETADTTVEETRTEDTTIPEEAIEN